MPNPNSTLAISAAVLLACGPVSAMQSDTASAQKLAPTHEVSGVTVVPQPAKPPPADAKIDIKGSVDDIEQPLVIWPEGARQTSRSGHVTLRCEIDVYGLAERCDVAYESPQGEGFGRAALKMRHAFKLAPTLGPDGPVRAVKNIQLAFTPPSQSCSTAELLDHSVGCGIPIALHRMTEITDPVWTQAATFDDLAAAYPAKAHGTEGYAAARCRVRRDGALEGCQIIKEAPEGDGFGRAAMHLAEAHFKVDPRLAAHQVNPVLVDVPVRFEPPQNRVARKVIAPAWLTTVDPRASLKLFPPEAAARGLTTGRGVVRCIVGSDGAMTSCTPGPGDPADLGFSEAAARIAPVLKMNLWSADGAPVEGGEVDIGIRFNLKATGG